MQPDLRHIVLALMAAVAVTLLAVGIHGVLDSDEPTAVSSAEFAAWEETAQPGEGSKPETREKADLAERDEEVEEVEEEKEAPADKAEKRQPEAKKPKEKAAKAPAPKPRPKVKKVDWKPAVLEVVTNFDKADVKVNGIPYPEYIPPGEPPGVVLPAGGPYWVEVTADGNTKAFEIFLRPNETRLLMVDLSGFSGKARRVNQPSVPEPRKKEEKQEEEEQGPGKVTVYSKPPGTIMVDGKATADKTPGTIEIENGRHEIQVEYDGGGVSEKKIVRVREGSRIKLFFRKRD